MKKIAKKFAAVFVIAALLLTATACDLVTVNTDRDMSQVVATVQISDDVPSEKIYKRELNAGFLSYGYQYVQYYGYTMSQAYQVVLDNLVSNKIIVQIAKTELAKDIEAASAKAVTAEELEKFLSEYEIAEAKYNLETNIDSMIESFVEDDEEEEEEPETNETVEERTAPEEEERDFDEEEKKTEVPSDDEYDEANVTLKKTDEELKADYKNIYDLDMAVFAAFEADVTSAERVKAINSALKYLRQNGLVSEKEEHADVHEYSYFKDLYLNLLQSAIVSNYEDKLRDSSEAKLTDDGLWDEFLREYQSQYAKYKNDVSSYETAMNAVTEDSYVLANPSELVRPGEHYGYVMNLLIPFSDEQSSQLTEFQGKTGVIKEEIETKRAELAKSIVAKDQRESWVRASRGVYNKDSKTFTFDKKYRTSEFAALDNFIGEIVARNEDGKVVEEDNGVEKTKWSFENVLAKEIPFESFYADYVTALTGMELKYFAEGDEASVGTIAYSDELKDKFDDLIYAFSTDPGSLGTAFGYLYSPNTAETTYVKEFAAAAKAVVNKGAGAYTVVLTDYGYHILLCTKVVDTAPAYSLDDSGKTAFLADAKIKDTLAYRYREDKLDAMLSSDIEKISQEKIYGYLHPADGERKAVTYYPKTYADLITE